MTGISHFHCHSSTDFSLCNEALQCLVPVLQLNFLLLLGWANVLGKDLDVFKIEAASLGYIL
jgi:hypothetical protein